jgi:hypothetical protein
MKDSMFILSLIALMIIYLIVVAKGCIIYRDAMLKKSDRWYNDSLKLKQLNEQSANIGRKR